MEQTENLFELPPIVYQPFRDPYTLAGQDKKDELDKMNEFIQKYQLIENPTQNEKEHYFQAATFLEADVIRQLARLDRAKKIFSAMRKKIIDDELAKFKVYVKLRFMEKYQNEMASGTITAQMSKDLDKLDKMEKNACYHVSGITVTMKDCSECTAKICQRKPRWEVEESDGDDNEANR